MILSVSRRTDIPAFYGDWFINRLQEGFVYVRNPFNSNLISKVPLSSEHVDIIVFWTKNAIPFMNHLNRIDELGYHYFFHYTITSYHSDIEVGLPNKRLIIDNFKQISNRIGRDQIILRYDPILINERYTIEYHKKAFTKLMEELHSYTTRVVISFIDCYKKNNSLFKELTNDEMIEIATIFIQIAKHYGLTIETCAESIDLKDLGIVPSKCVDVEYIENILQQDIQMTSKSKVILDGTREHCGCMKVIDIGEYNTCMHHCTYCYANSSKDIVTTNNTKHNKNSPLLIGEVVNEVIKERNPKDIKSYIVNEMNLLKEIKGK